MLNNPLKSSSKVEHDKLLAIKLSCTSTSKQSNWNYKKFNSTDLSSRNRRRYATAIHTSNLNQHEVEGGVRKTIGFKGIWKMHNYKIIPLTVLIILILYWIKQEYFIERADRWSENKW